ncbi:MAG: chemotaxis protein CheW [Gammaproteobacteria bacterium]|nr:chemotaxis protein CheW [Gammaproteobacteria bacterium]
MNTIDPFSALLDLEKRCRSNAERLPAAGDVEDKWVGVGFRLGDDKLIADMSEVAEILDVPEFTRVPGVKSWVVGIANVRGSLLPIMDLKGYILGSDMQQRKRGRLIVINYQGFNTGLLVDEIYGMRHFFVEDQSDEKPQVHDNVSPYIKNMYSREKENWPVFSFENMAQDERFSLAAL